jgi:transposase
MSSSSFTVLHEDARMSKPGPHAGGPTSRRSFTSAQKLDHVGSAYEAAMLNGDGGGYLRANGLYSSLICEWRRQRDAGVLAGRKPGEKIGRLTAEQAEIARLRRQLDKAERRLATTEVALEIMGKADELLDGLTKSSRDENPHTKP